MENEDTIEQIENMIDEIDIIGSIAAGLEQLDIKADYDVNGPITV